MTSAPEINSSTAVAALTFLVGALTVLRSARRGGRIEVVEFDLRRTQRL
jgi:hypothetical protein